MWQIVTFKANHVWAAIAVWLGIGWAWCGLPVLGADESSWPAESSLIELPEGFAQQIVAEGITGATSMALLPDGRILVCQQTGDLRLIAAGRLRDEPVLKLAVDSFWERGLIGITLDPRFAENSFVYLCYVAPQPYPHHRVSRFVLTGDRMEAASEKILWQGDDQTKLGGSIPAGHQGGAIRFGLDGRLYIALGEQTAGAPSQRLDTFQGKLLRINADGSIPADNLFFHEAQGNYRAIYARGLRNPFMMAVHPDSGRIFLNDVGGSRWEEINEARPGANFGWPVGEGPAPNRGSTGEYVAPVFAYTEAAKQSIAGGAFYAPRQPMFPAEYRGKYFFADYMLGWIRVIDVAGEAGSRQIAAGMQAMPFAVNLPGPVDIQVADDGSMYVLCRNAWVKDAKFQPQTGSLHRIVYRGKDGNAARIVKQPGDVFVAEGESARFAVDAAGKGLEFRWQRDGKWVGGSGAGETMVPLVRREDHGARLRCVVKSDDGFVLSKAARLRVVALNEPVQMNEVAAGLREERHDSGISFRGLVQVERTAAYTFHVTSNRAVKLYVAGNEVAAKGATAGPREASGVIGLKAGLHSLRFDFANAQQTLRPMIEMSSAERPRSELDSRQLMHAVRGLPDVREPEPISPTVFVPQVENELPAKLSETGIFRSLQDLTVNRGVIDYDVNSPLWSDGAEKRRWMIVPAGGRIESSDDEAWRFPAGTVFVKHFELASRRLETRLLVVDRDGLGYGATYRWRADGSDADLLAEGVEEQGWSYPSRKQCLVCHTPQAGFVLGVNTRQLNRGGANGENQLVRLSRLRLMSKAVGADETMALPRLAAIDDESQPLEMRARSYLDSNCAQCHQPGGVRAEFDARFRTPTAKQNLDGKLVAADLGISGAKPIFAGQPERSMILMRMERRMDVFNMPPLASHAVDEKAVDIFRRWISSVESKQRVDKGR